MQAVVHYYLTTMTSLMGGSGDGKEEGKEIMHFPHQQLVCILPVDSVQRSGKVLFIYLLLLLFLISSQGGNSKG